MKKWQESRNYRRIWDKHGNLVANIITVDGVDVPVTDEIFAAYSQIDRRERYLIEDVANRYDILSLEGLIEDNIQEKYIGMESVPSLEESFITQEADIDREKLCQAMMDALADLNDADRDLIDALYFKQVSQRQYAKVLGVCEKSLRCRKKRILKKIKKILEK